MKLDAHPTDDVLTDFLLGKLPDPVESEVEVHLLGCPECQARAASARAGDTFVQLLTAAGTRVAAARAAAATPQPEPSTDCAATQVYSGPPVAFGLLGAPAGLATHPRYRLVRRLGAGGMGDVWLAEHAVMGRPVALKVIRAEFLARPGAVERFRREVRAVAALHHPNIVTAFDADQAEGMHFLVMEYVPGEALSEVVQRGPLPVADACRAVRDAARGLAHAHAAGLVHRDVKPHNLIRATDGTTKVLDFGLVGAGADPVGLTGENMVMGTPDYIAPEQATDARAADARSDVYSLGCTLYHLLAGRVPFPADTVLQKLDAHRDRARTPDPIAGIPAKLARVLARMTAKDPAARYQTAEAVADALDRFCVVLDEAPTAAAPAPESAPAPPRSRRKLLIATGLVFALVAAAAGGVVYKIQRDTEHGKEEITIKTDDPDIEVTMRRNGELVSITDTKKKQTWELNTKKMQLKQDGGELTIDLPDAGPLVIRRNGDVAVTIERKKKAPDEPVKPIPPIPPTLSAPSDEVRRFVGHTGTVRAVAYSPDGKFVLSGSGWPYSDQTVRLWDVDTGKEVWNRKLGFAVNAVTFGSKDAVLAGGFNGLLTLLDIKTGKSVRIFDAKNQVTVYSVALSPNGRLAVSACEDNAVRVWDAESGKQLRVFRGHGGSVVSVAFSPDGQQVVSGSADGTVRLWDVETCKEVKLFQGTPNMVGHSIAFTPNGRYVLFGHADSLLLWNLATGQADRRFKGPQILGGYFGVAVAPDGKSVLAGGGGDYIVRLWDFESGKLLREFKGHTDIVWSVAYSGDGKFAVSGSGERITDGKVRLGDDRSLRVWRLPATEIGLVRKIPFTFGGGHDFSEDGKQFLATTSEKGQKAAVIFDAITGEEVERVPMPDATFLAALFLPNTTDLLVSADYEVSRWDRKTGKKVADLFALPKGNVVLSRPSADGKRIIAFLGGALAPNGIAVVYDLDTKKEAYRIAPANNTTMCLLPTFSPDGKYLATLDSHPAGSHLRLWDAATGKPVRSIDAPGAFQLRVVFRNGSDEVTADYADQNGTRLVVGTWKTKTGDLVRKTVVPLVNPPAGLAILPQSDAAYNPSLTGVLHFSDLRTGKPTTDFGDHDGLLSTGSSPKGNRLLVAGRTGMYLLRLPPAAIDP